MDLTQWKDSIIEKAVSQISYRANMAPVDKSELNSLLSSFLDDGISILRKWRKLKSEENEEFTNGTHDSSLVAFLKNKYYDNGKELYNGYSSNGISTSKRVAAESLLKSSCKQVL